jgi:hypothetical protein
VVSPWTFALAGASYTAVINSWNAQNVVYAPTTIAGGLHAPMDSALVTENNRVL